MGTMRMTTAQALIKFLNQQYIEIDGTQQKFVQGIFTIFGHGNVLGLGQALEQDPGDLIVHQGYNEQGMAHTAIGFTKQLKRQKVYAVTSSIGPGAANMVTAAATATANRIPLLLLPGDYFASRQPDPVLQQVEQFYDSTLSTNDCFRPVSRYWDRVMRPEQLMAAMIQALRVLTDPAETGAVTICLPQDVQAEPYDFPDYFFAKRIHRIERRPATDAMIEDAISLILNKKKPLIICGGGVRYSDAHQALCQFAETFNIPFAETQAGKSAIISAHPLNLGGIGTTGCSAANIIARNSDLIIGIGTRFSDFTTASKSLFQHPDVNFLTINIAAFDAIKLDATSIIADAKQTLLTLTEQLKAQNYRSHYTDEVTQATQHWQKERERLIHLQVTKNFTPEIAGHLDEKITEYAASLNTQLTQTRVLGLLNEHLEENAIIVAASGSLPGDLQRIWQTKTPDSYHVEYGYSCMGYEVAATLGAKLACPEQPVYAMVGDGAYLMLHSELATAVKENAKIIILLFDNAGYGCINNLQMNQGMGSFITENRHRDPTSQQLDGPLMTIDFASNAASYGCQSYTVHNEDELLNALRETKAQTRPVLIDIKVLPKTMTQGYEAWWRTGTAQVANKPAITQAAQAVQQVLQTKARHY